MQTMNAEDKAGPPLESISPAEAVALGAQSLEMFGKMFFPKTFRQSSPDFHRQIGEALYSPARYNAFEVFRDGAKTSLLRVFVSQRVGYAISRTIMYVSVSQAHAMMSVRWLKRQITYNKRYAETFGLRKGEKWTDEHCEIFHGIEDTPITILAMGITGQIRGFNPDDYRPDLIIIDDVLNEENAGTEEQRKKIESLIFGALLNSLAPASDMPLAKAVFLQTPLHKEDAIEKCLRDPQWNGLRFSIFDENGNSRWESRWPTETVKAEKAAAIARGQYVIWMREKECKVVSSEEKAFDTEKLRFWDTLPSLPQMTIRVISIDPASSESKKADDQVVMVVGFHGPDIFVLKYEGGQAMMPDKTAMHFFNFVLAYAPQKAVVESIGYQRVLAWYLEQEMQKRRIFLPIDKLQDRRKKSDRIIQAIAGNLSFGQLWVHSSMSKLIQQMDDYDPLDDSQHDDYLDALAMAISAVNPALRGTLVDGEFRVVDDESEYEQLTFGGCP
jgi:hypothetical protein